MKQFRTRFFVMSVVAILGIGLSYRVSAQKGDQKGAKTPPPASRASAYREIQWDELVPKDWDPLKQFGNLKLGTMNDRDPRAIAMLQQIQEAWDSAPTNTAMEGASVKLPGYLVPLEETVGAIKEFLLVPYFGACIHTPPPPANQIVHVKSPEPVFGFRTMSAVWVSGTLKSSRDDTVMGVSGYQMDAVNVERYVPPGVSSISR